MNMVLLCASLVFRMPWLCVTVGLLSVLQLSVHVGLPFLFIMCSLVKRGEGGYLLMVIMRKGTSLLLLTEVCSQVCTEPEL